MKSTQTQIRNLQKEKKNGSLKALLALILIGFIASFAKNYDTARDKIATKTQGIPILKFSNLAPRMTDDSGQIAPIFIIMSIVSLAIGAVVFIIVMVIGPGVAGEIITAFNVSADNPFYDDINNVDDKASSNFNLLWVALLVAIASTIISVVASLIMVFAVKRA